MSAQVPAEILTELRAEHRAQRLAVRHPTPEVRADVAKAYRRLKDAGFADPCRHRQLLEMRAVHGLAAMNKFPTHLLEHEGDSTCDASSEEEVTPRELEASATSSLPNPEEVG